MMHVIAQSSSESLFLSKTSWPLYILNISNIPPSLINVAHLLRNEQPDIEFVLGISNYSNCYDWNLQY